MFKDTPEPADYCVVDSSPENRLSQFERLTLTGGVELDRALAWISKQFGSFSYQTKLESLAVEKFFDAARFYTEPSPSHIDWMKHPGKFFERPSKAPAVQETTFHGLQDGEVVDLSFASTYKPQNPDFEKDFYACTPNLTSYARMWRHHGAARPTIVAIHGWSMGDQRVNSLAFMPGFFYQLGFDVALIELPYHGRRRSPGERAANAFLFPSIDVVRTNEAMGQVISDLRNLGLYLNARGVKEVGCMGMSLGAYVGSLWAALDTLSFCVPIVPMVSMAEVAWEIITRDENFAELREAGLTLDLLQETYGVHCPLTHIPQTPKDRMLIIAGIGDKIVPPRQPRLLWEHWKRPHLLWFRGGHVAQFKRSKAFAEVVGFFEGLGLTDARSKPAPSTASS
ncbi:MAG: hypothetical protein J0M12_14635 [Deltaproteobacteria bacterium]|nr:hypothetical protein [Deltaproteobacteria bacterium]